MVVMSRSILQNDQATNPATAQPSNPSTNQPNHRPTPRAPGSFAAGERNASSYALANMSASFEIWAISDGPCSEPS